jgi:hypothetical protein
MLQKFHLRCGPLQVESIMFRCFAVFLVAGCAQIKAPSRDRPDFSFALLADLGGADGPFDLASRDLVTRDAMSPPRDLADVVDGGGCTPKINEVETSNSTDGGTYEFVELYNPCGSIDLTGWSIVYRSATNVSPRDGNDSSTLYTFGAKMFTHGAYLVYAGAAFTGAKDGALAANMADDGAVGLRDGAAHLVDSVAYGAVDPSHAFIEGTAAPKPPRVAAPGKSISRIPDGHDTDNNAADFTVTTPTPGATNQ